MTHAVRIGTTPPDEVYARERARAEAESKPYLLDAWSFEPPGDGWMPAPRDLPTVFHPPEARGTQIFAVGRPFLPHDVQKGDCDQDRPN